MHPIIKNSKKLVLLSAALLFLNGCKPSPALTENLYSMEADDTDSRSSMIDNNAENSRGDKDLAPVTPDDLGDERERVRDKAVEGKGDASEAEKNQLESNTYSSPDFNPSAVSPPNGDNPQESLIQSPTPQNSASPKKTLSLNGQTVSIPENVDRVSAVGEAAVIVRMLGGSGRLAAVSESYTANTFIASWYISAQEPLPSALWSYSGASSISAENFQKLISLKPQVCFEISGDNTFTAEQITQLQKNDMAVVVLPRLNTSENIKQAVSIVAQVLGDQSGLGGSNAPKISEAFSRYYDATIHEVKRRVDRATYRLIDFDNDKISNGTRYLPSNSNDTTSSDYHGKFSLFVSGWDSEAQYKIYNSTKIYLEGKGVAVTRSGYSSSPLSYYMSLSGIINTAAMFPDFGNTENWYINPMIPSTKSVQISGGYTVPSGCYMTLTNNDISSNTTARSNGLGNAESFPAILAASRSIKASIQNDTLWKSYDYIQSANGNGQNFGFLDSDGGIVESTIIAPYEIYVNPKGIGTWTAGTPESILEPVWLAWKYYNVFSQDEVEAKVRDFYNTFYGITLTNTQLQDILDGPK